MGTVSKIDGFAGNNNLRARFVDIYVYADDGGSDVTFTQGEALAFEIRQTGTVHITVNGSAQLAATYFGLGNMAAKAHSGTEDLKCAFGILDETVTVEPGKYQKVSVQVAGLNSKVKVATASGTMGDAIEAGGTAGYCQTAASADTLPLGYVVKEGTDNTFDTTVILSNPLNL